MHLIGKKSMEQILLEFPTIMVMDRTVANSLCTELVDFYFRSKSMAKMSKIVHGHHFW